LPCRLDCIIVRSYFQTQYPLQPPELAALEQQKGKGMSSYNTTLLNVYLVSYFTLAAVAVLFALVSATTEAVRVYRTRATRHASPSTYVARPLVS
jgi:hypothetical protein